MSRRNASFNLFQRDSGRWYALIYDPSRHPNQIQRTLRTTEKSVARKKLVDWERAYADGTFDPWTDNQSKDLTVHEALGRYKSAREEAGDSGHTLRTRGSRLDQFAEWVQEGLPLKALDAEQINAFMGQIPGRFNDEPSIHTLETYYNTLSGFFSWCAEQGHIGESPMKSLSRPRAPSDSFTVLDVSELQEIRRVIIAETTPNPPGQNANRKRLRRFMLGLADVAVASMMRIGELCSIRWSQVRLQSTEEMTAYVRVENYTEDEVEDGCDGFTAKTRTSTNRSIFLPPRGAYVFYKLYERYKEDTGEPPPFDRIVFRSAMGKPLIPQTASKLWAHYVGEANVGRRVRFHDLRHTGISWALNDLGMPVSHVQEMAGHATADRTLSYKISGERSMRDAYRRVSGRAPTGETPTHEEVTQFLWMDGDWKDDLKRSLRFTPTYTSRSKKEMQSG